MPEGRIQLWREGLGDIAKPLEFRRLDPDIPGEARWRSDIERLWPWTSCGEGCDQALVAGLQHTVHVTGPASSSLDVAWELKKRQGLDDWDTVLTVSQWSGRGQMRRAWQSPAGNVHAAVAWPEPTGHPAQTAPLLAGLVLALALDELAPKQKERLLLKWPNDLLLQGRKVGGLLLEDRGRLIAGIGLNLAALPDEAAMREQRAAPAGLLAGWPQGPLELWLRLLPRLANLWQHLVVLQDKSSIFKMLEQKLAWMGEEVVVVDGWDFDKLAGKIVGISQEGALRLLTPAGERRLLSGSLALRNSSVDA